MKLSVFIMAVVEVSGKQSVSISIGYVKDENYKYLGSINCDFAEVGFIDSVLKKVPKEFLDYRREKWQNYLNKILEELASL